MYVRTMYIHTWAYLLHTLAMMKLCSHSAQMSDECYVIPMSDECYVIPMAASGLVKGTVCLLPRGAFSVEFVTQVMWRKEVSP